VTVHGISLEVQKWEGNEAVCFPVRGGFCTLHRRIAGSTARVALTGLGHIVHLICLGGLTGDRIAVAVALALALALALYPLLRSWGNALDCRRRGYLQTLEYSVMLGDSLEGLV
jgi:hypothetical protein